MLTGKRIWYLKSRYEEVKKPFIAENQRHSQHTSSTFIVDEYGSAADINAVVVATSRLNIWLWGGCHSVGPIGGIVVHWDPSIKLPLYSNSDIVKTWLLNIGFEVVIVIDIIRLQPVVHANLFICTTWQISILICISAFKTGNLDVHFLERMSHAY